MCLGVPGLVVEVDELTALVDFWGVRRRVRLDLVDEPVAIGDYVLNHVGFAIRRIPPEDVAGTLALYEQLLKEAGPNDLMAADVRSEIAGRRGRNGRRGRKGRKGGRRDRQPRVPRSRCARRRSSSALAAHDGDSRPHAVSVMHVCGSHEQAIAKFGLRASLPARPERHHGAWLSGLHHRPARDRRSGRARAGRASASPPTATWCACRAARARWPTRRRPARTSTSSTASRRRWRSPAARTSRWCSSRTGFETTAVATAAVVLAGLPPNLSVLSAHKYIPPVMEIVAEMPGTRVEGFLAAGHAATITGWGIFEAFVARHARAGRRRRLRAARHPRGARQARRARARSPAGGRQHVPALRHARRQSPTRRDSCGRCSGPIGGRWRGIAHVPNGNLRLRDEWAAVDARRRFTYRHRTAVAARAVDLVRQCICGNIMAGIASPADCPLFGSACVPDAPVGACMVSSEGTCRIWHEYGGVPEARRCWHVQSVATDDRILLKHGAGGRAMRRLIEEAFLRAFETDPAAPAGCLGVAAMDDGGAVRIGDRWLVMTTDSHVDSARVLPRRRHRPPGGVAARSTTSR